MMSYRKPGGKGKGQGYSPLTLRTLSGCMTALFNHAVKYYGLGTFYSLDPADRIFTMTKYSISHRLETGAAEAGVKRIRVHDLRHSHVSLLIDMGFSAIAIADRVGHESIDITYRYAHLFPTRQMEMADRLDRERLD